MDVPLWYVEEYREDGYRIADDVGLFTSQEKAQAWIDAYNASEDAHIDAEYATYVEGWSASQDANEQLHNALVEISQLKQARGIKLEWSDPIKPYVRATEPKSKVDWQYAYRVGRRHDYSVDWSCTVEVND